MILLLLVAFAGFWGAADLDRCRAELRRWPDHEEVLRVSPFSRIESVVRLHISSVTPEVLVHRALSMSATSAARLGPRTEAMVADIDAAVAPFGRELSETIEWTALIARRPGSSSA